MRTLCGSNITERLPAACELRHRSGTNQEQSKLISNNGI